MKKGTVKFFNSEKGFGFIICDETGIEYFVHISGILDANGIKENDHVQFDLKDGQKGENAVNVTVIG